MTKTDTISEKQQKTTEQLVQLIVFKLGDEEYGVPIEQVKEIVLTPAISKVPKTPKFISGVTNIRGSIIALIDLEVRFGIKEKEFQPKADPDKSRENDGSAGSAESPQSDLTEAKPKSDLPAEQPGRENDITYTLVIEVDNYTLGLIVNEVPNTLNITDADIDKAPGIIQEASIEQGYIKGICNIEDRLIILLDLNRILTFEEFKQLATKTNPHQAEKIDL